MKGRILYFFVGGLLLRLFLLYSQYSGDVKNHLAWGTSLFLAGSVDFFSRHFAGFNDANYPPIAISLFGISVFLYSVTITILHYLNQTLSLFPSLLVPLFESENMRLAFLKLPGVLADLGVGLLIFLLTKKLSLLFLYLFNPAVIYLSTVWGQIESIPLFFLVLSLYFVSRSYYLSHFVFILAVLSKQTALWLIPVFLILWLKKGDYQKLGVGLLIQLVTFFLIYLPFALPITALNSFLATLTGSSNSITDQAFNLWYFIYGWETKSDSTLLFGLSVRLWSLTLLVIVYSYLTIRFFKKYSLHNAANYLFLLSLAAFFLQTRVHDRHLAPALPFLLLSTFPTSSKISLYVFLSAYHMYNLYLALRLPFI